MVKLYSRCLSQSSCLANNTFPLSRPMKNSSRSSPPVEVVFIQKHPTRSSRRQYFLNHLYIEENKNNEVKVINKILSKNMWTSLSWHKISSQQMVSTYYDTWNPIPTHFSFKIIKLAILDIFLWAFPELREDKLEIFRARWSTNYSNNFCDIKRWHRLRWSRGGLEVACWP